MPLHKDEAWFRAKTYGWGWGLPSRWQGWIVMLAFILALTAGTPFLKKEPLVYVAYCFTIVVVLIGIAYWKGEKPHWSWGKRE